MNTAVLRRARQAARRRTFQLLTLRIAEVAGQKRTVDQDKSDGGC